MHEKMLRMLQEICDILQTVKNKVTDDSDMIWTSYEPAQELRDEIDTLISQLSNKDTSNLETIYMHFLPTSTFQEHSLQNGWSGEYMMLAEKFDELYATIKKYQLK